MFNMNPRKILIYIVGFLGVASFFGVIALGGELGPQYYWGFVGTAFILALTFYLHSQYQFYLKMQDLRETWGKEDSRRRDFDKISFYFTRHKSTEERNTVDDQTWSDLDFDKVYSKIDRTLTLPGGSILYSMLRTPFTTLPPLLSRDKVIREFQTNTELREQVRLALHKFGRPNQGLASLLWNELPKPSPLLPLYHLLSVAALLVLPTPLLLGSNGVLMIFAIYGLNTFIHYRLNQDFAYRIPAITALGMLIKTGHSLSKLDVQGIKVYQEKLQQSTNPALRILKKTKFLYSNNMASDFGFLMEYIKILFLLEVRSFYGTLSDIKKYNSQLKDTFILVGELDALQSIASYRETAQDMCEPKLTPGTHYDVEDIRHPLLAQPVPNSIAMDKKGVLITGSNMSGKSTFLRTVGINAILAQSINRVLAKSYHSGFFQVVTSINKADSLDSGKSFYYAEAERLLKLLEPKYSTAPALCLIDEMLSGTNYAERLAASQAILEHLKVKNALVIVSTHDLDLAVTLKDSYNCHHFTDNADETGMTFDYKLKPGVTRTYNAIRLLGILGYPKTIITKANQGVKEISSNLATSKEELS